MSKKNKDNPPVQTLFTDQQREKMASIRTRLFLDKKTKVIISDQDLIRLLVDNFDIDFYLTNI